MLYTVHSFDLQVIIIFSKQLPQDTDGIRVAAYNQSALNNSIFAVLIWYTTIRKIMQM